MQIKKELGKKSRIRKRMSTPINTSKHLKSVFLKTKTYVFIRWAVLTHLHVHVYIYLSIQSVSSAIFYCPRRQLREPAVFLPTSTIPWNETRACDAAISRLGPPRSSGAERGTRRHLLCSRRGKTSESPFDRIHIYARQREPARRAARRRARGLSRWATVKRRSVSACGKRRFISGLRLRDSGRCVVCSLS